MLKLKKQLSIYLLVLFFISRLIFINAKEVFFDSKEYLTLFANPSFYKAITLGHTPIHEGYIILFWPVYQLAMMLKLDPGYIVVFAQILLATLTVYCFYKTIIFISDKNIALFSAIIIALTPLFWITNITITLEISYVSFYFLSLYLLTVYLSRNKWYFLFLSLLSFSFSFITYSAVILWLPVYLAIVFYKKRAEFLKILIVTVVFLFFILVIRLLILSVIFHGTPLQMLYDFYLSNATDAGGVPNSFIGLLIRIRNFIPVLRDYTSLVFIISIISLFVSFIKNKNYSFIGLLWIIPILYTNQWWDSLLVGRYSILAGFGISFLTAYLINKYRIIAPLLVLYILIVSVTDLSLLRMATPYIQEENYVKTLPANGLFIESHYAQPVLQDCCKIKMLGVNRPDIGNIKIMRNINEYLRNKKPVFISSDALSDPYGLYSGPYLHSLSLSYDHGYEFTPVMTKYQWKINKIINKKDNVIVYQILSKGKSHYPEVMNMTRSYRRLDYYDPITRMWWLMEDLFGSGKKN